MNTLKKLVPQSIKNWYHFGQAVLANLMYGFPSRKIKVIGVTGTNGKTTTVQMITKILEEAGHSVAMASTINFKLGEKEWVNATKYTTLSSFTVQKFIKQAVKAGCEYLVLETSSHSLDQYRVWGVAYDVAVITNVTREHLDYHKTMEGYSRAKERLFQMVSKNNGVSVVNLNMDGADNFLKYQAKEKYGYSIKYQVSSIKYPDVETVKAENIKLGINKTQYMIHDTKYILHLPGEFNIENALAATCVGLSQGISLEACAQALGKIEGVPGRMQYVHNDRGIDIIIDYAVTPDSLQKLYDYIKQVIRDREQGGKVISVMGSCGDRDRGKRPIMGEIVGACADYICVTNEDPYGEDPVRIINEVFSGVVGHEVKDKIPNFQFPITNNQNNPNKLTKLKTNEAKIEGENCWRIMDRRIAIREALRLAKPGDIVVVTGKGAEEVMAIGNQRIPWNERQVIEEELKKL